MPADRSNRDAHNIGQPAGAGTGEECVDTRIRYASNPRRSRSAVGLLGLPRRDMWRRSTGRFGARRAARPSPRRPSNVTTTRTLHPREPRLRRYADLACRMTAWRVISAPPGLEARREPRALAASPNSAGRTGQIARPVAGRQRMLSTELIRHPAQGHCCWTPLACSTSLAARARLNATATNTDARKIKIFGPNRWRLPRCGQRARGAPRWTKAAIYAPATAHQQPTYRHRWSPGRLPALHFPRRRRAAQVGVTSQDCRTPLLPHRPGPPWLMMAQAWALARRGIRTGRVITRLVHRSAPIRPEARRRRTVPRRETNL